MKLKTIIVEGALTLTTNKLRTGLAMLGIVIGIGSVIALISLGEGSRQAISSQIESLGSNLLTISPGSVSAGGVRGGQGGATTLTLDDAKAISTSTEITTISTVSPEVSRRMQITTASANTNTQIIGVLPEYATVHKINISQGVFITSRDSESMSKVAVLGPTTATTLFGSVDNALDKTIRINNQTFRVVGVTVAKGGTGFQNQDDIVFVPLLTAQKQLFGISYLNSIALEAKSANSMVEAQNQVGYLLLSRHKLSVPSDADFSIFSQQDILNSVNAATGTFTTLLSGVAAISLLVGGIGIMNIMLVTVTERTREIGLRKALGARKGDIITRGIIGVIFGVMLSFVYSKLTNSVFVVTPTSVGLSFVVSTVIGLVFGWYPARRASNLQPIEALRYE